MKRLASIIIAGAVAGTLALSAQTNFNLWLSTEGAGVQVNTAPRPYYPGYYYGHPAPPHYHHHGKKAHKRYKKMRKAQKKYYKAQKEYYKEMRKAHRHHHHDD